MRYTRWMGIIAAMMWSIVMASAAAASEAWHPVLRNFTPKTYGAGTQNWDVKEGRNGWMYVANSYGMLEYDGARWLLYGNSNASIMHVVEMGENGCIFAGGVNEFGYYSPLDNGRLKYHSLIPFVPASSRNTGEVWKMHYDEDVLYVQTRLKLFVCRPMGGEEWTVEVVDPACLIYSSIVQNHTLYLATDKGLYLYSNSRLLTLRGNAILDGKIVSDLVALDEERFLVATDLHGVYVYDGNTLQPFRTEADAFLKQGQIYSMAVSDRFIAYGTVLNGVLLTDKKGRLPQYVNMAHGLQNNTVLSMDFDRDGNLWLGLDQGLSIVDLDAPLRFLSFPQMPYGTGYGYLEYKGMAYLATNQGLYAMPAGGREARLVAGSSGQVWKVKEVDGHVYCCHNRGLYEVTTGGLQSMGLPDGAWDVMRLTDGRMLVCSYSGYYIYNKQGGRMALQHRVAGFDEPTLNTYADRSGRLWIMSSQGIERLTPNTDYTKVERALVVKDESRSRYVLAKIDEEVVVTSEERMQVVTREGTLETDSVLPGLLDGNHCYPILSRLKDSTLVYMTDGHLFYRSYDKKTGRYAAEETEVFNDYAFFVGGFANMCFTASGAPVFGGVDGFYQLISTEKREQEQESRLMVRGLRGSEGELLYGEREMQEGRGQLKLPYGSYRLEATFAGTLINRQSVQYRSRLLPTEKTFSNWTSEPKRDLLLLRSGTYTLEVEQRMTNAPDARCSMEIVVARPWYNTWWSWLLYVLLSLAGLTGLVLYTQYRVRLSQRQVEAEREMEIQRQQTRILQLESEQAQSNLRSKSRELNSVLLNQVNRNEIAASVQQDVQRMSQQLEAGDVESVRRGLMQLEARLKAGVHQDKDWKRFEENFDFVNNQFMQRLGEQFPWMSKQEKKLCVYIYMGLQTKEIGPLLDLTTRGVEMKRYRLRQKMNLSDQTNLKHYFEGLVQQK